jgi:hypothetical protein
MDLVRDPTEKNLDLPPTKLIIGGLKNWFRPVFRQIMHKFSDI